MFNKEEVEELQYNDEEHEYFSYLKRRLEDARDWRNKNHTEFNDMDFLTWYDTNKRAANAYIPPKKNKSDTRIVSGTTKEKEDTILSAILNYKLAPDIVAYDSNNIKISGHGEDMEDLLKKTREDERYDDKKVMIYKEMLDQGTVFAEEALVEKFYLEKKLKQKDFSEVDPNKIDWTEKLKKLYSRPEVSLIEGAKVYLGNIKEFFIWKQPYLFTVEYMHYDEAAQLFQNWERWKYVPRDIKTELENESNKTYDYYWALDTPDSEYVEIIKYQDKTNNEYQIIINGIMMVPIKFPLTAISPSGEYTLAKGDVNPIGNFAYSNSIPSLTKVDQEVLDEFLRLMVLKTQKSFAPTLANRSNKMLSQKIFNPATIINGIDPSQIQPIFPEQQGVNNAEFNAYQFIKGIVDSKSVSPAFSGQSPEGEQTATEVLQMKKQQMMKLGLTIWGVISLERQLAWLRCYNLKENLDKIAADMPGDEFNKPSFSVDNTELPGGMTGRKIIELNKDKANNATEDEVLQEDSYLSKPGQPVKKVYLNPEELRRLRIQYLISITPTEKDTDELKKASFIQNIQDAGQIFGMKSLNMEYLKERFAEVTDEDGNKFFRKERQTRPEESPIEVANQEELQRKQKVGGELAKQLTEGVRSKAITPKLKK